MEKFRLYRNSSLDWKPSAVLALATSADGSQVAAAREDGAVEVWLVSPGSVGWHCQLTIQGNPGSRVSSLAWLRPSSKSRGPGRLLSSSLDGSLSEWDLFSLQQKAVVDSVGVAIWQMAVEPSRDSLPSSKADSEFMVNGSASGFSDSSSESSQSDDHVDDDDGGEILSESNECETQRLAIACDDGCVRLYVSSDSDGLSYKRTFPWVNGRVLSVAWSLDAKHIFSGSSNGLIRCWDATNAHEVYRITVGVGGIGGRQELCVWSLLPLKCGTLVSGDSAGCVQFWDSQHGTLLQAHSDHKGDVNALAASPSHNRVFSAGSDGQVILYKLFTEAASSKDDVSVEMISKWVYVRHVRAHTHDIRALTVAMPICVEDTSQDEKKKRLRGRRKPVESSYCKWAHLGVPMLISAGDDTKLFAYSVREFTKFSPHDVCPTPQRLPVKLAQNPFDGAPLVLVQYPSWLDISSVQMQSNTPGKDYGKNATTPLLARVKSKGSQKIICSALSNSGAFFAYSDHVKPCLFELRRNKAGNAGWAVCKRKLPHGLPFAHAIIFSVDSSRVMLSGHDRKIYMLDVEKVELINVFVPRRKDDSTKFPSSEPPITRMFTSLDGQWLAAVNCFGDIYVFNLEINRQHWFISRLNGASVTAGGFLPNNSNILVITTSSNHVFVFDVEAKQLGEWSRHHSYVLPRKFQDFPGEIIGLSFPPSSCSTSVIIYSSRAMCFIDFGMPVGFDAIDLPNGSSLAPENFQYPLKNGKAKRKRRDANQETKLSKVNNFDFFAFRDPVLFLGHMSEHSLLVLEKPWMKVVQTFDAPVHRHIFGT